MAYDATADDTRLLLQRTIDVLQRDGWCLHTIENERGNHCLAGALNVAHHGDGQYRYSSDERWVLKDDYLFGAIKRLGFDSLSALCAWNNVQTSVEPVIARLEAAIAKVTV